MVLKRLQAATGALFAVFVAFHLVNTWLAAFGAQTYDGVQAVLRAVYQFAPVEALLLAALSVHMVVGILRIVREPKRTLSLRAKLHRYAGFFLLVFIFGHIVAVRGASWFFDVYPGFAGLAFSIAAIPGYFYPYYFLLGLAGFYHGLNGLGIALNRLGLSLHIQTRQLRLATAVAGVLLIAALLGLGGVWFDVGDNSQSGFAKLAMELMGEPAP
jgi:succinate dehydrogenase/fumarate reductase cytochrome b subunit